MASDSLVTVTRTSDTDVKHRQVILSIDGEPFATLMFGQEATRPIAPGHHRLRAYNTLVWKTLEFDLAEGGHAHFAVASVPGKWTYAMVTLLGVGPMYVTLERTAG